MRSYVDGGGAAFCGAVPMSREPSEGRGGPLVPGSPNGQSEAVVVALERPSSTEDPVVPDGGCTRLLVSVDDYAEVAHAMIEEARIQNPQLGRRFDVDMDLFCWDLPICATADTYRAHVRELLERLRRKESLRAATKAEVLAVLCADQGDHPRDSVARVLIERLFEEVLDRPFPQTKLEVTEALERESRELFRVLSERKALCWREPGRGEG